MMADVNENVLKVLENADGLDTVDIARRLHVDHQKVVGAVKSLQALGNVS